MTLDHATPTWVEAQLAARGWRTDTQLHLVLPLDHAPAAPVDDVRPVDEHDWPAIRDMLRLDHAEEDRRAGRSLRPPGHTDEALTMRRGIAEHADYLLAADDEGTPVGFVCAWTRTATRHGILEDVFVHPRQRRRGLASTLITVAVGRARWRAATEVVIAADPADTPKVLYQRLGFIPCTVARTLREPS